MHDHAINIVFTQASYLIADEETKEAAIVDPRRDVEIYVDAAKDMGMTVTHVLETHLHADFISGHMDLAERTGATIVALIVNEFKVSGGSAPILRFITGALVAAGGGPPARLVCPKRPAQSGGPADVSGRGCVA